MRTLLYTILFGLASLIFFCSYCLANEPDEILHTQCLYPTVLISPDHKNSYGSGVIVRSSRIAENEYLNVFLTAAHVADSYEQYTVKVFHYEEWSRLKSTTSHVAVFYARDFERDLAIGMFISDEKMPVAKIDMDTKLYIGNEIFHIGCGLGDDPRIDCGKVTSIRSKVSSSEIHPLYRTSAHTVPGDSGGPLFNKYRVVGIARSIRAYKGLPVFCISYYVPITYLRDWSNEEEGAYDFVWKERSFPRMIFWELHFSRDHVITRLPLH